MGFSQFAGTAIMPTLARIVLGVAFVSVGYNKLFTTTTLDAPSATILRDMYGIEPQRVGSNLGPTIETVAFQPGQVDEEAPVETGDLRGRQRPADEKPADEKPEDETKDQPVPMPETIESVEDAAPKDTPGGEAATPPVEPLEDGEYTAKSLYKITLMMHHGGLPYAFYGAWIAAITEFVGGILLLLGFFSRVWGLGLAIAMGVAFYLVTVGYNNVFDYLPWTFAEGANGIQRFNTMYSQLGLGVLALGVFCTGPGPISVDRMLFGSKREGADSTGESS